MKVLIADSIDEEGIDNLKEVAEVVVDTKISYEDLIKTINEYDGIIIRSRTKLTKDVIDKADNLKIIARAGVGVDNVDLNAATDKGIMVVNTAESTIITVAEHTMGLILAIARKISIADKSVKDGKWEKSKFLGSELRNKTLGVIGMGRIGSQVVRRCKAFEMDAVVYDPYLQEKVAEKMGIELTDLETVLKEADVITIHVPLTPQTKHLISKKELKIMKNTAFIVNCARGGIIDEDALYDGLKNAEISGVALDVYENEPPKDNKLLKLNNVVLTPHIAASTQEAQRDAAIIAADEVTQVFKGKTPKNVLNLPVVDQVTFQKLKPYFNLSEKLGKFISQFVKGKIETLEVVYCGELSEIENQEILTRTILKGVLSPVLNRLVNTINSFSIAKSRDINVIVGKQSNADTYDSIIRVKARTESDSFTIEGTQMYESRIIKINDYRLDVKPEKNMFLARYHDVPGSIGSIGSKLGEHDINVGVMQVGRDIKGGQAIMVLTVDNPVPADVIKDLEKLDNVYEAVAITL
ncbi:MAG: phosphoglycerate dehydrogenase [Methanobrevibacter sp.]|jgi:D-3-phosphoglycerate dehydrogenase|nr:phosphoglycerate dehydrogenase [Candidatus Methanovirga basalitermitum]